MDGGDGFGIGYFGLQVELTGATDGCMEDMNSVCVRVCVRWQ